MNNICGFILSIIFYSTVLNTYYLKAQTLSLHVTPHQEFCRWQSLKDTSNNSFMNYPLDIYTCNDASLLFYDTKIKNIHIKILPTLLAYQYNSFKPSSYNDGAFIAAKGSQYFLTTGMFFQYKWLSAQLMPELIYAPNENFFEMPADHPAQQLQYWIDYPERYGHTSYRRLLLGETFLKISLKSFRFGISNQNMWWGPAKKNALVMSNNAQGFLHFFVKTENPILTKMGTFETQFIIGLLENSTVPPSTNTHNTFKRNPIRYYRLFEEKVNMFSFTPSLVSTEKIRDDRYISGINFVWNPKWIKGLFLGISSTQVLYTKNLNTFFDYVPFFNTIRKEENYKEDLYQTHSININTVSFRWVFTEVMGEIYAEYGNYGKWRSLENIFKNPSLDRGFTLGVTKLFSLKKNHFLQLLFEMTELQQNSIEGVYSRNSWYTSNTVRHGYTNNGKLLGAGIGPGSNTKYIQLSWLKNINSFSVHFELLNYNNDIRYFIYRYPSTQFDTWKYWTELHYGCSANVYLKYTNTFFHFTFKYTYIYDYRWLSFLEPQIEHWQLQWTEQKNLIFPQDAYNYFFQIKIIQPFYK
ncbi:MAG: capsule assembly Wzi family protein, partial [Chitinophagaceae bacterium]|nr:capsule assembly Wzi family protein [Chitinophagaceae bacterium]